MTADKDFGELVFRQGLVHSGVVLLRLAGLANATKAEIVAEVCRTRTAELAVFEHWISGASIGRRHVGPGRARRGTVAGPATRP